MNSLVIPWPEECNGDFTSMVGFLEELGIKPHVFVINFIISHGTNSWTRNYCSIEDWIYQQLDTQFSFIAEKISAGVYSGIDQIYDYTVIYDKMHDCVTGDDVDFEELIYATIGILRNYYSFISLPDMELIGNEDFTMFLNLSNGFALINVGETHGRAFDKFYSPRQQNTRADAFSFGTRTYDEICQTHGISRSTSLTGHSGICNGESVFTVGI